MPLVIEDGSLVANANSFVSVAEVRAYANARTSPIPTNDPAGDAAIEAACIVAIDFLETFRGEYQGGKVDPASQSLQWPRSGVTIDGWQVPTNTIPKLLKDAQCQLAIDVAAGVDLMPSGDGREVIRKKIDVLETEYAPGSGGAPQPILTKARALIEPLLSSGFGGLRVIRA